MNPKYKPSKTFFKYLKQEYALSRNGFSEADIEERVQNRLLMSAYGATAWVRTKKGAEWTFKIIGVEEVDPHPGFMYYYMPPHGEKRRVDSDHGLRIFRRVHEKPVDIYHSALDIAKKVIYTEGWEVPDEEIIKFVFNIYRTWLRTPAGFEWIKSVFRPVMNVYALGGIAYKCTSVHGETYWMGRDAILPDPNQFLTCDSCDMSFPCTGNYSSIGRICNRCYAENFAEVDVLELCSRHECKNINCENHISEEKIEGVRREMESLPIKWSG